MSVATVQKLFLVCERDGRLAGFDASYSAEMCCPFCGSRLRLWGRPRAGLGAICSECWSGVCCDAYCEDGFRRSGLVLLFVASSHVLDRWRGAGYATVFVGRGRVEKFSLVEGFPRLVSYEE